MATTRRAMPDLSQMTEQEAIAALQRHYAQTGTLNAADPYEGTGFSPSADGVAGNVAPSFGNEFLSGFRPDGDGFTGNLTSPFDPATPGGRYGSYQGRFSRDGTLDPASVAFSPEERSGSFVSENMLPLTLAVMGGTAAANGLGFVGPGSGAEVAGGAGGYTPFIPEAAGDAYLAGGLPADFAPAAGGAQGGGSMSGWVDGPGLDGFDPSAGVGGPSGPQVSLPPGGGSVVDATGPGSGIANSGLGELPGGAPGVSSLPAGAAPPASSMIKSIAEATGISESVLRTLAPAALATLAGATTPRNPTSTNSTTSTTPPWLEAQTQAAVGQAGAIAQAPTPAYTGPNPQAPLTGTQRDAIGATRTAMDQFGQATAGARDFMGAATDGRLNYTPGTIERASNGYIGQTTGAINGPGSIADKISGLALQDNPYLGKSSERASTVAAAPGFRNPLLGMNNPALNSAIGQAQGDVTRQYNLTVDPQLDAAEHASGSFGNTGVQQMRLESQRQLANELGRVDTNMRMADYNTQAGLGEGEATRSTGLNTFNAGQQNAGSIYNAGLSSGDLTRDVSGFQGQQNPRLSAMTSAYTADAGNTLNTNVQNQNTAFGDLGRNSSQTQNLSQFNSGVSAGDISNAGNAWAGNMNLRSNMLQPTLNYANAPIGQARDLMTMGNTEQNTNTGTNTATYNQWLYGNEWPMRTNQNWNSSVNGAANRNFTSTGQQQVPGANPWATGIGTFLAANQFFNGNAPRA